MFEMYKERMEDIVEKSSEIKNIAEKWELSNVERQYKKILERWEQKDLNIAVVGKVKKGKSSLINALIGENLLPVDILPARVCDILLRYGEKEKALIQDCDGNLLHVSRDDFQKHVSTGSLANAQKAEVTFPSAFLNKGIRLVDTPGFADIDEIRSEVANVIIPQMDALVVVLDVSAGGLDATEMEFLKTQVFSSQTGKLFFVLNKTDMVENLEDMEQISAYVKKELQNFIAEPRIIPVSARLEMESIISGEKIEHENSGLSGLRRELASFVENEAGVAIISSAARDATNMARHVESGLETVLNSQSRTKEDLREQIRKLQSERKRLEKNFGARRTEANQELENLLMRFQNRLDEFMGRYTSKFHNRVMLLHMDDLKNPGLAAEMQKGIEMQMRCFMESQTRELAMELDEIMLYWDIQLEQAFENIQINLSEGELVVIPHFEQNDHFVIPGVLLTGWVFLGFFNFILLALTTSLAGDTIKKALMQILMNPAKTRKMISDQVYETLEDIRNSIFCRFSSEMRSAFQKRLKENIKAFDMQLEGVEESIRNHIQKLDDPDYRQKMSELETDLKRIKQISKNLFGK